KPVPDVSVEISNGAERGYFQATGVQFEMRQRSWRDTITSVEWSFTGNADVPTKASASQVELASNVRNRFRQPGWVNVTLKAIGNNTGDSTQTFDSLVYVADVNNRINPLNGFFMDFEKDDANNPIDKWPIFNYFKNDFRWKIMDNVGYTGSGCISYSGFDTRVAPMAYNGTPKGDYDDFFTPAFDLSGMKNTECRLNFMSSGAFRVTDDKLMRDTLQIHFSIDSGKTWILLRNIGKADLGNKGLVTIPYAPLYFGDWKLQSINIPMGAREPLVFFRFRFRPNADDITTTVFADRTIPGTGNNFFIDRINISPWPEGVNTLLTDDRKVALAPNPTTGSSQLIIKSASKEKASITVTDVTGKVVYTVQHQLNGSINTIEIPAQAVKVKGVYMVHVQAGAERFTEKLVSY
ncbi:MAG: T9SS type A sorting domain-containing protein, partial [Taibaiella sp.]|nr:T9SS type A sorting domain-containing protein [Taibaiella sp.]